MVARVSTVAFQGIEGVPVEVQVMIAPGKVLMHIVGLPDKAVAESRERVQAALHASGLALPPKKGQTTAAPDPKWFQPRPSAAGAGGYDPTSSGASNLGPNDPTLIKTINQRRAAVAAFDHVPPGTVPADALTASGSGLDPDISPAYAYDQVDRVAHARGLSAATVRGLVAAHVQDRTLGFLGEPRVNVVELNQALAALGG